MDYSNRHLREIAEDYIHSERDRQIFCRKYCDKITLERLAEEFDVSVSQIKRITWRYSEIIFRHIEP